MDKKEVTKMNFFKKIWYSITKFEQYPTMATEGAKSATKYLVLFSIIISIIMMFCSLYEIRIFLIESADYIQEEIPEFAYSNGKLLVDSEETILIDKFNDIGINKMIINTKIETDDEKTKIENDNLSNGINLFLYDDQVILKVQSNENESLEQKYEYQDLISGFVGSNIQEFNKSEFIQYLKSGNMTKFYCTYAISAFVSYFIENFIVVLIYSVEIAILGWITTIILRIKMRFKVLYSMSAYSITLSTILMTIYMIVNYFTGFVIKEFQIAYIAISYICLATAIFILKDDFMKKMQEVEKIKKEQLKVREEIKENQDNKEEKKKDDNNEQQENNSKNDSENDSGNDDEPQGSEV